MPATLESPKGVSKQEEYVEKQIESARRRIRVLDWFAAGLLLGICSLAFLFVVLLVDRYVETPSGAGWGAFGLYLLGAVGFVYLSLFRPSRRQINPFFAAHQVEITIPDAKNSVVNYVDLKDDASVPGSVKTAIGARAAKDLKNVDLNQVIQKRQILWFAGLALFFLAATAVVAFLPPTRTTLTLLVPEGGNATIVQGNDFRLEAEIKGRIPQKTEPDAPRVRIWYNPDDDASFEDRPLEPVAGEKYRFGLTIPAKQTRSGFRYQVLAGNVRTAQFEVKIHIIPQFTGWTIDYDYPAYLQREPGKSDNPNLVSYYNTMVTLTAFTNRPVKSGAVEIEGQLESIIGQPVADNPEAIRFRFPMLRSSHYRIRFVTTENQRNPDPQRYRLSLLDPLPTFLNYDVTYDYPKYLRAQKMTVEVRQPNLEALRGTRVTLVGHANRPIKEARVQFPGVDVPIVGIVDPKKPMQATFELPAMLQDGDYRITLMPKTDEGEASPAVYTVRVLTDEAPKVEITKPQQEIELPANGTLVVEGIATDDIGIDKMTLRLEVVAPTTPLAPKPYRNGISFRRDSDQSYPTRVDYKDFVELAKLRPEGEAGAVFQLKAGMVIKYWLEAIDNCDVPPGPYRGKSQAQLVKILPPVTAEDKKKLEEQQQQRQNAEQDQKKHEQKQDQQNAQEKRDPKQPQPKGDPQPNQDKQQPQQGDPKKQEGQPKDQNGQPKGQDGQPMPQNGKGGDMQPMMGDAPMQDPNLQKEADQVQQALNKTIPKDGMPEPKPADPMNDQPKGEQPKGEQSKGEQPKGGQPKSGQPKDKDGKDDADAPMPPPSAKPEDLEKLAEKLKSDDPKEKQEAREQLKQMMEKQAKSQANAKDQPKPKDQEDPLEKHRQGLDKEEKEKFDQAMKDIQKEMQNIKQEEQAKNEREDRVKKAADKAMSNDPKQQEEGQKELEKELQNQNTRDDVDRQLQNLANGQTDPEKKKKLEDANNLSRNNLKKQEPNNTGELPPPKKEEEDVDRLAKKMQKGTDKEKQEAQDQLQKKLEDPKQRDQVQKQLDDIKNNIQDKQAKDNFEKSMEKIKDNLAKNDLKNQPKSEDIQKFAENLTSDNKQERDQAQKQLEDVMKQADKNPDAREQAQKQLNEMRDNIKDPMKKEQFDKAMDQIGKAVDQQRKDEQAKAEQQRKQEAEQLAKDLTSSNQAKKEAAEEKLEKMLQDPKTKEQLKKDLDEASKNNPDKQQALNDAVKKAQENVDQKNADAQAKKEDVQQLAKDLQSKDPAKQAAAQEKLEKMINDPKNGEKVKDELDNVKKEKPESKQAIDDAMRKAAEKSAQQNPNGTGNKEKLPTPEDIEKLAKALKSDDPKVREQVKKQIEQEMKKLEDHPKERGEGQKKLQEARDAIKDEKKREEFDKNLQDIAKEVDKTRNEVLKERTQKAANDLQSKDPAKKQAAQEELEKMLKDPAKQQAVNDELEKLKKEAADQATKQAIDEAKKKAEQNLAKKEPSQTSKDKIDTKDAEKLLKDLQSKDAQEQKAAADKLREMLQDATKRAELEKQLAELSKDPEKVKQMEKAMQEFAKKQIDNLIDKLQNGTPAEKQQSEKQLDDLLKDQRMRDLVKKQLDELMKNMNEQAKKDLQKKLKELEDKQAKQDSEPMGVPGKDVDLTKHDGKKSNTRFDEKATGGAAPDLKNKVKAGELFLDKFKKNISNEEFQKQLGWTPEQMAEFQRKYEKELEALRNQLDLAEKGELPMPRVSGPSVLDKGPERINLDRKDDSPVNSNGKLIAPPGFADPYGRFTEEVSGKRPPMKK